MVKDLNKLAREIIESNQYLTLATSDEKSMPWASPVVYAYDKNYNFYFVSIPSSRHCNNIGQKAQAAIAIFDSRQMYGEGVGLQIEGKAEKLEKSTDVLKATAVYFQRKYPYRKIFEAFDLALKALLAKKTYCFYKITPTKIWINNPNSKIDERVEINLHA